MRLATALFVMLFLALNIYGLVSLVDGLVGQVGRGKRAYIDFIELSAVGVGLLITTTCCMMYSKWFELGPVFKLFVLAFSAVLLFVLILGSPSVLIGFYLLVVFFILFIMISGIEKERLYGKAMSEFVAGCRSLVPSFRVSALLLALPFLVLFASQLFSDYLRYQEKQKTVPVISTKEVEKEAEFYDSVFRDNSHEEGIAMFIDMFQRVDIDALSRSVVYPFSMGPPLEALRSEDEFIKNFHLVFDSSLIEKISQSKIDDWRRQGRGYSLIYFDSKLVSLNDNASKILSVHHYSEARREALRAATFQDKINLHASVRDYSRPVLKVHTDNFIIRIDYVNEGYRLSVWDRPKAQADKPDVVLHGGVLEFHGSLMVYSYSFQNGAYEYVVSEGMMEEINISVSLDGKEIHSEGGRQVYF